MRTTRSLQEVVCAIHFSEPLPLTVVDAANWADHFSGEYPIVQQLPAVGRTDLGAPQARFELATGVEMPRLLLRSVDGQQTLQLQPDRFAYGWQRTEPMGELSAYPGFPAVLENWEAMYAKFEAWSDQRFRMRPSTRLVELSYINAVPIEFNGQKRRISEIFKFVQPGQRMLMAFQTVWVEAVRDSEFSGQPVGQVTAQVGVGEVPGISSVIGFNFSGLGAVAKSSESKQMLNRIHDKIREMYEASIAQNVD